MCGVVRLGMLGKGRACGGGTENHHAYLSSCIDNLRREVLLLVSDNFAKRVLDGRVVALDEVAVNELDRQTRLACPVSEC